MDLLTLKIWKLIQSWQVAIQYSTVKLDGFGGLYHHLTIISEQTSWGLWRAVRGLLLSDLLAWILPLQFNGCLFPRMAINSQQRQRVLIYWSFQRIPRKKWSRIGFCIQYKVAADSSWHNRFFILATQKYTVSPPATTDNIKYGCWDDAWTWWFLCKRYTI